MAGIFFIGPQAEMFIQSFHVEVKGQTEYKKKTQEKLYPVMMKPWPLVTGTASQRGGDGLFREIMGLGNGIVQGRVSMTVFSVTV